MGIFILFLLVGCGLREMILNRLKRKQMQKEWDNSPANGQAIIRYMHHQKK